MIESLGWLASRCWTSGYADRESPVESWMIPRDKVRALTLPLNRTAPASRPLEVGRYPCFVNLYCCNLTCELGSHGTVLVVVVVKHGS